ncbi:MAG: hypothetical protein J6C43_00665 [Oscillospiraceae bacterium]|nr:hypothetical protein [Oscillospiraceae bacterium]MBP3521903.1 hypothetical protein [Oscillospiraceae bacterium]
MTIALTVEALDRQVMRKKHAIMTGGTHSHLAGKGEAAWRYGTARAEAWGWGAWAVGFGCGSRTGG